MSVINFTEFQERRCSNLSTEAKKSVLFQIRSGVRSIDIIENLLKNYPLLFQGLSDEEREMKLTDMINGVILVHGWSNEE